MFEPMSARFASSCSRNGISAAAGDTSWIGETSMYSTSLGVDDRELAAVAHGDRVGREAGPSSCRPARSPGAMRAAVLDVGREELDRFLSTGRSSTSPVRRLEEAELVHPRVGRERRDEADVRAFRRLDRAHAAVVRVVDVAHLEAGAIAREAARSERRETALVRQLGQRVRLVHELRELARAEERLDHRRDRARVDQVVRRDLLGVLQRHALADDARHAGEADVELVRQQLADRAHAAVAEVVDVVRDRRLAAVTLAARAQQQQVLDDDDEVLAAQRRLVRRPGSSSPSRLRSSLRRRAGTRAGASG